jgi:hypothetical protein
VRRPYPLGGEGDKRQPEQKVQVGLHNRGADAPGRSQQMMMMMMVVPVDADDRETQDVVRQKLGTT